jgi:hypothetical protein
MADDKTDLLNPVAVQKNALIGDDNLSNYEPEAEQVNEDVDAQVTGPAAEAVDKVKVSETYMALDEVITDASDPRAVQIPDAGRGSLDLPIHQLARAGTPEQQFAEAAAEDKKSKK